MRPFIPTVSLAIVLVLPAAAFATPRDCNLEHPPAAPMPSRAAALDLLGSLTQLDTPIGRPVLTSNLAMSVAINNHAPQAVRAQALRDAQVTAANAATLADGLGWRMAKAYRQRATFEQGKTGDPTNIGAIGPATDAVLQTAMGVSGRDSAESKCAFANGVLPFQGGRAKLPPGGVFDVLGKAYRLDAGTRGADPYGNSRPYMAAPLGEGDGLHIQPFDAVDFFGVPMSSRVVLAGATAEDRAAGRFADPLDDSPSYPSGHTTFAYTEALLLAMMVPERYRALAYRASEYGHSRIVLGAHYAVDVIGGRTLATYDLAQAMAGTPGYAKIGTADFRASLAKAATELRDYLQRTGCADIAACARDPIERAGDAGIETAKGYEKRSVDDAYAFRLTYGLAPLGPTDRPAEPVPAEAATLLESRFPYLSADQRREILRTTEGPSGHFLDVDPTDGKPVAGAPGARGASGVYSRLDLFAAAGGYGRFASNVTVDQDIGSLAAPDLAGFARNDVWSNAIDGAGGLTKRGRGRLTLSGQTTYEGPTRVEGGTLDVQGGVRAPIVVTPDGTLTGTGTAGDVTVSGGTLAPGTTAGTGTLVIDGSLAMSEGSKLSIHEASATEPNLKVAGKVRLDGALLVLKSSGSLRPGASFTLLSAGGGIAGTFAHVRTDSGSLVANLTYAKDAIYVTIDEANSR